MYLKFFVAVPAVILYLFLFWRRLKEDYPQQVVFTAAFFVLFGILVFFILSIYYRPEWWFWFAAAGAIIGFLLSILRFKLKITETIDASVLGLNMLAIATYFYFGSIEGDFRPYILVIFHLFLFLVFWILDQNYKKFTWYRSGKIGFAGILTLGFYFLIRSVVALYFPDVVSFIGKDDAIISAVLAFLSFLGLFNLARQTE